MKNKKIFYVIIILSVILIAGLITINILERNKYKFPESGLSEFQDENKYTRFNGLVRTVNVEDLLIDVPESNFSTSAPAYLYNLGNDTVLCITEAESLADNKGIVDKAISSIDTTQKKIKIIATDSGYLNGFYWNYIGATSEDYAVTIYTTQTISSWNFVIASIVRHPNDEFIRQGVVIEQGVIGTIIKEKAKNDQQASGNMENPYAGITDLQTLYDTQIWQGRDTKYTQQYNQFVVADDNYEHLRLTVNWIDTFVTPRQLRLFDRTEELEYEPVLIEDGKYVFIVDDVSYGDILVLYFDMPNPHAIAIQLEEESDYEAYADRSEDEYADFLNGPSTTEPTEEDAQAEEQSAEEVIVDDGGVEQ